MSSALGEQALVGKLLVTQIGEESYPVQTAYINNIVPVPAATLQQVCDQGNTTDTGITVTNGDINVSFGGITALTDINAGGSLNADLSMEAENGNITCPNGSISCGNGMSIAGVGGDFTTAQGDVVATIGNVVAGNNVTASAGNITAVGGDIVATARDFIASAGGILAAVGNSQLNRCEYTTDFGGTTSAAPLSVAPPSSTPLRVFTLPTGTFQLTVFLTNSQPAAQEFAFEVHNLPANVLRDYQIVMNSQTYDNGGGGSMGFNGIVIGESIADPTNNTKITCVFNVAIPYVAQKLKCNVRFEYNPSP